MKRDEAPRDEGWKDALNALDEETRARIESLIESERRLRSVFERAPVGIYRTTPDGRILFGNPALVEMLGYNSMEALKEVDLETEGYHADTPRWTFVERIEHFGEVLGFEAKWMRRDGKVLFVRENARAVRDAQGNTMYYEGTVENITRVKQAEANLRASEEKYRSLFESMLEGFALHEIICDADGKARDYRFLDINPSFEQLTGLRREEVIGKRVKQVLPDLEPRWVERYGRVAQTGEATRFSEYSKALGKHFEVIAFSPKKGQFATIFSDITDRKEVEDALDRQMRFERLLNSISSRFVNLAPDEVGRGIKDALKVLGEFMGVDRSYVMQFSPSRDLLSVTHEWNAEGVDAKTEEAAEILADGFPWSVERINAREIVHIPSMTDPPPDAGRDVEQWDSEDIQSILLVPLACGPTVLGALGFDAIWQQKAWSDHDLSMMGVVGEIFASALDRKRIEEELRLRLEFEDLITGMSSQFVNLQANDVDTGIENALRDVAEFAGVDRGYVFIYDPDNHVLERTHVWCAEDGDPWIPGSLPVDQERIPWELALMRKFEVLHIPSIPAAPPEAETIRQYMGEHGIKSMLCIPFALGHTRFGFLGFSSQQEEREWPQATISALRLVGEIFSSALQRKALIESGPQNTRTQGLPDARPDG